MFLKLHPKICWLHWFRFHILARLKLDRGNLKKLSKVILSTNCVANYAEATLHTGHSRAEIPKIYFRTWKLRQNTTNLLCWDYMWSLDKRTDWCIILQRLAQQRVASISFKIKRFFNNSFSTWQFSEISANECRN